ncbi:hypothetical protein [Mycobacterium avium]|uniref:hypothetical protein n=1 Tax=Mycobacterium avium TaxID=1764 RepID=UPI00114E8C18|nr:hypothetical protein [Mycobacterium avium]
MNLEEARELMNKLNHGDADSGVGRAKTLTTYETKPVESPDGELLGMERVGETELPLGHVGPARACCDAPGDEHEPGCVMYERGEGA